MIENIDQKAFDNHIAHVLHAAQIGIMKFAGTCEIALIAKRSTKVYLFDPYQLFQSLNIDKRTDQSAVTSICESKGVIYRQASRTTEPELVVWFVKLAPGVDCKSIIGTFLDGVSNITHSAWQSSLVAPHASTFAVEVIQHWILDVLVRQIETNPPVGLSFKDYPTRGVLDCLLRLSRAAEEGNSPSGTITFLDKSSQPPLTFTNEIPLNDSKHVCKLFPLAGKDGELLSNGTHLSGISIAKVEPYIMKAVFCEGTGLLASNNRSICRIVGGEFRSSVLLPSQIIASQVDLSVARKAQEIAASIAEKAINKRFGCLIIMDADNSLTKLSGHYLNTVSDDIELTAGMAKVDGAVIIDSDGFVKAFGCILDGDASDDEILSRGSRFNSARRFSRKYQNQNLWTIVVSADGPLTIFHKGQEIYSDPWGKQFKRLDDYGSRACVGVVLEKHAFWE